MGYDAAFFSLLTTDTKCTKPYFIKYNKLRWFCKKNIMHMYVYSPHLAYFIKWCNRKETKCNRSKLCYLQYIICISISIQLKDSKKYDISQKVVHGKGGS